MSSARQQIKPHLDRIGALLAKRHGVRVTVAMLRDLRDYGLACRETAYTAITIPVPADGPDDDGPEITYDEPTRQYSRMHPHYGGGDDET